MAALGDKAPYLKDKTPDKELCHIWMRFFIPAAHRVAMANARVLTIAQMKYFATDSDELITNPSPKDALKGGVEAALQHATVATRDSPSCESALPSAGMNSLAQASPSHRQGWHACSGGGC